MLAMGRTDADADADADAAERGWIPTVAKSAEGPADVGSGEGSGKLRGSCETCARSKVKCGHEKPVCSRCEGRGLPCQYLESRRPGRVPGSKPKRSKSYHGSEAAGPSTRSITPGPHARRANKRPSCDDDSCSSDLSMRSPQALHSSAELDALFAGYGSLDGGGGSSFPESSITTPVASKDLHWPFDWDYAEWSTGLGDMVPESSVPVATPCAMESLLADDDTNGDRLTITRSWPVSASAVKPVNAMYHGFEKDDVGADCSFASMMDSASHHHISSSSLSALRDGTMSIAPSDLFQSISNTGNPSQPVDGLAPEAVLGGAANVLPYHTTQLMACQQRQAAAAGLSTPLVSGVEQGGSSISHDPFPADHFSSRSFSAVMEGNTSPYTSPARLFTPSNMAPTAQMTVPTDRGNDDSSPFAKDASDQVMLSNLDPFTVEPCECTIKALDILKDICRSDSRSAQPRIAKTITEVLLENKRSVEQTLLILTCPSCKSDRYLLTTLLMISMKLLLRYTSAAASCNSLDINLEESSDLRAERVRRAQRDRSVTSVLEVHHVAEIAQALGGNGAIPQLERQQAGGLSRPREAVRNVLRELHHVQKIVIQLSLLLKDAESTGDGLLAMPTHARHDSRNSFDRQFHGPLPLAEDTLAASPLSPKALGLVEDGLKHQLSALSATLRHTLRIS